MDADAHVWNGSVSPCSNISTAFLNPSQDVSHNKLSQTPSQLVSQLKDLTDLTWLGLEGNPIYHCPGYQADLLQALTQLESVDTVNRPEQVQQADVWVNPADAAPDDPELRHLLTDVDPASLLPTVEEIEKFKQAMNINSKLPVVGIPSQQQGEDVPRDTMTGSEGINSQSQSQRPGTGLTRPGTASLSSISLRPGTSSNQRPGTASTNAHRPGTASSTVCQSALLSRPGSARVMGMMGSPVVKDVLMHQKPLSCRTGGGVRLMTPEQYAEAVGELELGTDVCKASCIAR